MVSSLCWLLRGISENLRFFFLLFGLFVVMRLFSVFSPNFTELTESSRKLGRVHRVLPSFSRSTLCLVPGNRIDLVSSKSVTNRQSRIELDQFFEP